VVIIQNWELPTTVKKVQFFLGFYNFYWQFIKDYSCIVRPLFNLTRKNMLFNFNSQCLQVFKLLKKQLISVLILIYYDLYWPTKLETDALNGVVAEVLFQLNINRDRQWHPVIYFSKTIALAECNYAIHNKKLLAII